MKKKSLRTWKLFTLVALIILTMLVACQSGAQPTTPETATGTPAPPNSPPPTSQVTPAPTDDWFALFQRTPFPYTTPLPPSTRTILDGAYAKLDPSEAEHFHCRRCPDYAPEGGIWKLSLDKGVFRMFYQVTGWRSIGSFTVSGDRLTLFNDPYCTDDVGDYTWKLEHGALTLQVIKDECAIRLRAMNLTMLPWLSCQPPNTEAAVTDHWLKPPGCQ